VCSTRNVAAVRSLGADRVIDYTREDFVHSGQCFDLILDRVGNRSISARKRVLAPTGSLVVVSGSKKNRWVGPLGAILRVIVVGRFSDRRMVVVMTKNSTEDLVLLGELLRTGKVTPVIERTYPLHETAKALQYVGEGHAQGKIVIAM
jgi:NADPH:quinone reductase-like Zn-dependent oxidoreductase